MEILFQDLRYGARMLTRNVGFTALIIIALALGIGANTAVFSVVNGVLLRPLPYKDADRLATANLSIPDYKDVKEGNQAFDDVALWASNLYNLTSGAESEQVRGAIVSANFFPMLGDPLIGRIFSPEEERDFLAVISHDVWQSRFAGDTSALGKTLNLSGQTYTIIGVMPPEFQFPDAQFKVWVTMGSAMTGGASQQLQNRSLRIFRAVARLKPGIALSQAQAEVDSISERLQQQYPETNSGVRIAFTPIYERMVGNVRPALMIMLGAVGFVLLIACANVANLLLARATAREREMAIRSALGAGRWRLSRQLITESLLLSILGGALGLLLAAWGIDALPALSPGDIPRLSTIGIDVPVMLFTLGVSIFTGILFGLAPALQAARPNLNEALKEGGRGMAGSVRGRRLRGALVMGEIALSLVVLVGAGLLIKSFARLLETDPGFVSENLLTTLIQMPNLQEPSRRVALAAEAISRIEQIPGVVAVGGGTGLPPQSPQRVTRFEIAGRQIEDPNERTAYFLAVSPDYFRALGTRLFEGRAFNEQDGDQTTAVVIINQSLARRLFSDESAVGRQLKLINPEYKDDWRTIVGVVADVRYMGLDDPGEAAVYTPFAQTPFFWSYVMVRTASDPASFAPAIRDAVTSVNADLTAARIRTMEQLLAESVAPPRFNMLLLAIFAVVALVLAAIGIYGVIAYTVTQRTHEIGIRMALGAQHKDVLRLIIGHALALTMGGIAAGVAGGLVLTQFMQSLLYGVSATDPVTFVTISLLLIGVAFLASYIPARRATKVSPMIALRHE